MNYICTVCGKYHEGDNPPKQTDYGDGGICEHNWIADRGLSDAFPDVEGVIELEAEIIEESNKENNINVLSLKKVKNHAEDLKTSFDNYNELNRDLETMYSEIKSTTGLVADFPEFKQVVTSLALYNNETSNYLNLITSKIVDRSTILSNAKMAIGIEKILTDLLSVIHEKGQNITDDEVGDNNLKFVILASKAFNEYKDLLNKIKTETTIPEVDRKLKELKKDKELKEKRIDLSQDEIQSFLKDIRNEKDIDKFNNNNTNDDTKN